MNHERRVSSTLSRVHPLLLLAWHLPSIVLAQTFDCVYSRGKGSITAPFAQRNAVIDAVGSHDIDLSVICMRSSHWAVRLWRGTNIAY